MCERGARLRADGRHNRCQRFDPIVYPADIMTSDTMTPTVPQVIVTPPPPPPSPFLLPPSQPHLSAQHRPLDRPAHCERGPSSGHEEHAERSGQQEPTGAVKRKRVRFKLDSDPLPEPPSSSSSSQPSSPDRRKRLNTESRALKKPRSVLGGDCVSGDASAGASDVKTQSDNSLVEPVLPSHDSQQVFDRMRSILGKFSESVTAGEAQNSRNARISAADRENTDTSSSFRNNSLSSESRTRICFENVNQVEGNSVHISVVNQMGCHHGGSVQRPHSAFLSLKTEGKANDTSAEGRYGSSSFSKFNTRPLSSEMLGRSAQYKASLVNMQLYRIACRHLQPQHVHDNLQKQTRFDAIIQNGSEDRKPERQNQGDAVCNPRPGRCAELCLKPRSASADCSRPRDSVSINRVSLKPVRCDEFSFGKLGPPKPTTSSHPDLNAVGPNCISKNGLSSQRAKLADLLDQPGFQLSGDALNSVRISGRSVRSIQADESAHVAARMMVSKGVPDLGPHDGDVPTTGMANTEAGAFNRLRWSCTSLVSLYGRRQRSEAVPPRNAMSVALPRTSVEDKEHKDSYKLTKVEFRRLTEQVRDVDNIIRNKFRKPPAEKLYRLTAVTSPDPATQALRDELQASRLPFHARQWRPLSPDDLLEPSVVRCRPVSSRPTTAHGSSPALISTTVQQRPRSTPVHSLRSPHTPAYTLGLTPHPPVTPRPDTPRVEPGKFDTLSPRILSRLVSDVQPRPLSASYGDRIVTRAERRQWVKQRKERDSKLNLNDDVSTTSGIDSDYGDDVSDENDDEDDDSSDSENGGFEPSLDDIRRQMPHPQSLFRLRPEKLDAIYVPEDKRDMRRFDFDAENVDLPPYNFKRPLPDQLAKVNLRLCAREGSDWRDFLTTAAPADATLRAMMDRLVELEKCQIVTEEWEAKKLRGQARRQEKQALNGGNGTGGARGGGSTWRARDKRCCGLCLQAACVGDCPEKRQVAGRCEHCHQPLCTGACQDSRYEQRMRTARSSENLSFEEKPLPPPPRSPSRGCYSCLRRHNAKVINANNLVLGRPKSSLATFARGKSSSRPRDLRPASAANMSSVLLKDFERLGIEPQQPAPPSKAPPSRLRSRNGLLPGKSSRSNRKNSISDSGGRRRKNRHGRGLKVAQNVS